MLSINTFWSQSHRQYFYICVFYCFRFNLHVIFNWTYSYNWYHDISIQTVLIWYENMWRNNKFNINKCWWTSTSDDNHQWEFDCHQLLLIVIKDSYIKIVMNKNQSIHLGKSREKRVGWVNVASYIVPFT